MHLSMRRLSALYKAIVVSIFVITGLLICFISIKAIAAPVDLDLPAQPLSNSLKLVAKATGASVAFDSKVTEGITAPAIKGRMESFEAIRKLLAGTGLEASTEGTTTLIKRAFEPTKDTSAIDLHLDDINIRAKRYTEIGPMPGLALTKDEIPGNVQSITAKQIKDAHSISLSDLMNSQLQSVNVNDYQGNPFQMDVTYRGFTASPQLGTPQGLSVFLDGIRVNEPFGDVVNWDMIPMNALAGIDVFPGSNPIFGLGTLGGALSMRTKNGFDDPGVQADMLTGAFGRKQFQLSAGGSHGDVAGFVALNLFNEDGWRQNSPSKVNQIFSKLSYRNDKLSLDGSMLYAWNDLVGNGLIPIEMYNQSNSSVYTSPDDTKNKLLQFQIASAFQVSDTFNITGQIYNRKSDRKSSTGDVNTDFSNKDVATRRPLPGENAVCAYGSTNGVPNYYVVTSGAINAIAGNGDLSLARAIDNGTISAGQLLGGLNGAGLATLSQSIGNGTDLTVPADYLAAIEQINANYIHGANGGAAGTYNNADFTQYYATNFYSGGATWNQLVGNGNFYTATLNGNPIQLYIIPADPINVDPLTGTCGANSINSASTQFVGGQIQQLDANGSTIPRDGKYAAGGTGTGYIDGTPTAIISDIGISQLVKGGAVQLNWNTDQHKFMIGSSLDHATDTYTNSQRLGLLDSTRNAYLDPANIGAEYTAASAPIRNNDFNGSSDTRSLYFSETYSPKDNLHFNVAARYNYSTVMTNMRTRKDTAGTNVTDVTSSYLDYLVCTGSGLDSCDQYLLNNPALNQLATNPDAFFGPYIKERFNYHKINPSLGATWSPTDNLNVYANWNQGTRTPSAIELGCAFDRTPTLGSNGAIQPASLAGNTSCTLPNSLSGDPYLPQVVARTFEMGARGKINENLSWNASMYNTNLTDDIYFVSYTATKNFFDTIGRTRRRGIETGISGKYDKFDFKLNYSLTDATFETNTTLASADNSSVDQNPTHGDYGMESIHPGDRMPGIALNNINASVGYSVTDKWRVGMNMVAHGESYARGNENNEHQIGTKSYTYIDNSSGTPTPVTVVKNYTTSGKNGGYAVFNFSTSYDIGHGWSATLLLNNVFDKTYYSASRLGINPFSPSINGAIGVSGYNYNSNDWQSTNFVAPGAPRAAWISVRYEFEPDRK
ncbi:TonB-dependent receptor domain-containing protein [Methyloradius palustris]|uniref:Secretin/TonB short N-terminal domain-containing protein n=1 Tax=Methyloradius palustris TaxID=2778876 RepID=A0A8D5G9Q5_9PROT|nr:TonB-dependent receptor [Methyloradius palustris]BCM25656.1 hypothetical protein ZMTM_19150 [Methyloradius palustris]